VVCGFLGDYNVRIVFKVSVGLGNIWRFPFTAYENGEFDAKVEEISLIDCNMLTIFHL
jgi:hypothetical protein